MSLQPPGIEPEISAWQAESLPLAYGCAGCMFCYYFCSTFSYLALLKVEKAALQPSGIEPETSAWKAKSLPLAYGCFVSPINCSLVYFGPPFIKNEYPLNSF